MKEENKKNIYEKLQLCRVKLNDKKIKKSGKNSYSGYEYFELKDFLPIVNQLFEENKISSIFNLDTEEATLDIINTENVEDRIVFSIPVAEASIKGSSPVQALGGQITYLRRYLYINALEIAESDIQDKELTDNIVQTNEESLKLLADFDELLIATETEREEVYKYYKVKDNTKMTNSQLKLAIELLKKKPIVNQKKEEVF